MSSEGPISFDNEGLWMTALADSFPGLPRCLSSDAPWLVADVFLTTCVRRSSRPLGKGVTQRLHMLILRPAAAVECPGREAKGRRDVSERFPTAGQAGTSGKISE